MDFTFQLLLNGLVVGFAYALVALGLTLVFGLLDLINFAHGEFYMLGAFVTFTAVELVGMPYAIGAPVAVLVTTAVGYVISRGYIRLIAGKDETAMLLGTLGLSYVLAQGAHLIWSGDPRRTSLPWRGSTVEVFGTPITIQNAISVGVGVAICVALLLVLRYTNAGRIMTAVAENRLGAALSGIPTQRVQDFTFAVGGGLAAVGGATLGASAAVFPDVGQTVILKAFIVVILAGLGSVPGAIVAGLSLGLVESLGGGFISTAYRDSYGWALLILVLLIRTRTGSHRRGVHA